MIRKELIEKHRQLAALYNNHCHQDLKGMPETERRVAIQDMIDEIESLKKALLFETYLETLRKD